jgi:arginase
MTATVELLVIPYDSGVRETRMGAGPRELIRAGIVEDLGAGATVTEYAPVDGLFRGEVASAFDIQRWLSARVSACRDRGAFPLVLAGNCSTSVGTFAGLRSRSRKVPGVCWFDAHGDFNTPETTESGFLDGMALAMLTGRCWTHLTRSIPHFRPAAESSVLMFGTRDLDTRERKALLASGIHWPSSRRDSVSDSERLTALRENVGEVYLHIDLDVLDESVARVNQFACPGGMTTERVLDLIRAIGASFHIGAAALTAWDPSCDPEGRVPPIARSIASAILTTVS